MNRLGTAVTSAGALVDAGARAQARWEVEVGRRILSEKRGTLLLACLPILILGCLEAAGADAIPSQIPVLGGSRAYLPAVVTPTIFYGSILVGLVGGLITGVIGAGGGYILTPALMSFGVQGIMAVGTDQFHLFAKALIGTSLHRRLGNVNLPLALWFIVGSFFGVTAGGTLNRAVYHMSSAASEVLINGLYVLVLGCLALYCLADWLSVRKRRETIKATNEATTELARRLQALSWKPRVRFDEAVVPGGRAVSIYPIILCGFVVGLVAAIMGVGGGFLTFPMFVYGLGVSTFTTVGTDILQIAFTTFYSSIFQYAIFGFVFYTVAMGTLLGSLLGVQIGAAVTTVVTGAVIRAFYALTILAGFSNRLCALIRKLADMGYIALAEPTARRIDLLGTVVFFVLVGAFGVSILAVFFGNLGRMRGRAHASPEAGTAAAGRRAAPWLADRKKLGFGLLGLASFFATLSVWVLPLVNHRTGLERADALFNQLAKGSIDFSADALRRAERFRGVPLNFGVNPRWPGGDREVARIVAANGLSAQVLGDSRVRIVGDLGALAHSAAADAHLLFTGQAGVLQAKYGLPGKEVVYCWWSAFQGLARRYTQENRPDEAEFATSLAVRVLEPAYNFAAIEARQISDSALVVTFLLVFYVVYTLWLGFSIMAIFAGLGLQVTKPEKREG
ncbi:MAG TPA: sulfite exporter TauE/SafE family protein [Candidatus Sulfotelmatobacter sp.]|nr:sulfite exporter TauE/SafE family protein [Candidatus Sulfotelmatobacter sp.]